MRNQLRRSDEFRAPTSALAYDMETIGPDGSQGRANKILVNQVHK